MAGRQLARCHICSVLIAELQLDIPFVSRQGFWMIAIADAGDFLKILSVQPAKMSGFNFSSRHFWPIIQIKS